VKVSLATQDGVEDAVLKGLKVRWRDAVVFETRSGNIVVKVSLNKERYQTWKLAAVIRVFGVIDFYYENGEKS
jgi:hypothetical protein